jgi:hypothetical protein
MCSLKRVLDSSYVQYKIQTWYVFNLFLLSPESYFFLPPKHILPPRNQNFHIFTKTSKHLFNLMYSL